MKVNGTKTKAIIDSGAAITVLKSANGNTIAHCGNAAVTLDFNGLTFSHQVVVADIKHDLLIGVDFLKRYNGTLNFA